MIQRKKTTKRNFIIPIAAFFILLSAFQPLFAGRPIPDTGQTKCYDDADPANEIDCTSLDYPGQDAMYTINPPSYTKLDEYGKDLQDGATSWAMVRDNVTGLIWEVKHASDEIKDYSNLHDADNRYTWYDPNPETNGGDPGTPGDGTDTLDFINALNENKFGSFSDWRMPTPEELHSIADYDKYFPSINKQYFPNTVSSYYWSSSSYAGHMASAWGVDFYPSYDDWNSKSDYHYVRAVRGEQSRSFDCWVINSSGDTVTDTRHGIMWQRSSGKSAEGYGSGDRGTWVDALAYCEDLILADYSDWRLPNIKELNSLVNSFSYNPAIDTAYFPDTVSSYYWSSSSLANNTSIAWGVHFNSGNGYWLLKSYNDYVRAIRGGQIGLLGHLIIDSPAQASKWSIGSPMTITWDTQGLGGNVYILLYRQGRKTETEQAETPEIIADNTENDGVFDWTVSGDPSVNCVLEIVPDADPEKATTQGLFMIGDYVPVSPMNLTVSEPGGTTPTATFNIRSITPPREGEQILIDLQSSNPGECSVLAETVVIDSTNWQTGVDVTVTGETDKVIDGPQECTIITSPTRSSDGYFDGVHIANVRVTVEDDSTGAAVFSVYPTYGTTGEPMDIEIEGAGFIDGQFSLILVPEGGGGLPVTNYEINSETSITASLDGLDEGVYGVKVVDVSDSDKFHEIQKAITITTAGAIAEQNQKKAVIIAGGGPFTTDMTPGNHGYPYNTLWDATKKCADMAYFSLYSQGYAKENIHYLSADAEDENKQTTLENIDNALNTWAKATPAASELIVYLTGPGSKEQFIARYGWKDEILEASALDAMLDRLQSGTSPMTGNIIIVYDACMSGSFASALQGENRIIITGTAQNERAWFLDDGEVSFSYLFWRNVFMTGKIDDAFNTAKNFIGLVQTPLMDAGGILKKRSQTGITIGRGRLVSTQLPTITTAGSDPSVLNNEDGASDIFADGVSAGNGVGRVWARIVPPSEYLEGNDQPVLIAPTCKLMLEGERYEGAYSGFSTRGTYSAFVYVKDKLDFQSLPKLTSVTQQAGEIIPLNPQLDINGDGDIDLTDLIILLKAVCNEDIGPFLNPAYKAPAFDVDGDFKLGLPEAINLMRIISG